VTNEYDLTPLDLLSLIPRLRSAEMRGVSVRTLDNQFRGRYVEVSARRKALPLYLVLGLPAPRLPGLNPPAAPPPKRRYAFGVAATRIGRPRTVRGAAPAE
jgi:hypothetical protein